METKINWKVNPKEKPQLGDEILICYGENNKLEIIFWSLKFLNTKTAFMWFKITKPKLTIK